MPPAARAGILRAFLPSWEDMAELTDGTSYVDELPAALDSELESVLEGRHPAVFLDYDGTLTPIVQHPDDALLAEPARRALARLAEVRPVAIVSGRDRQDVEDKVGLAGVYYAGSHGFDISGPNGFREQRGAEYRSMLGLAAGELEERVGPMEGVWVERKRYAVAVHFRQAPAGTEQKLTNLVENVARKHPALKSSGGKKIFELRPNLEWDKGRAVLWLLEALDLAPERFLPVYVGDDETDEDAFRILAEGTGLGVVVGDAHRPTFARLSLSDPDEVTAFLEKLAEAR